MHKYDQGISGILSLNLFKTVSCSSETSKRSFSMYCLQHHQAIKVKEYSKGIICLPVVAVSDEIFVVLIWTVIQCTAKVGRLNVFLHPFFFFSGCPFKVVSMSVSLLFLSVVHKTQNQGSHFLSRKYLFIQ